MSGQDKPPGFAIIPAEVLDSSSWHGLSGSEKDVYTTLARFASGPVRKDRGESYPSMDKIAKYSKATRRTAEKAIKRLCERGLILRDIGGGRNNTNLYTLQNPVRVDGVSVSESPKKPRPSGRKNPVQLDVKTPSTRTGKHTNEQTINTPTQRKRAGWVGARDEEAEEPPTEPDAQRRADVLAELDRFGISKKSLADNRHVTAKLIRRVASKLGSDAERGLLVYRIEQAAKDAVRAEQQRQDEQRRQQQAEAQQAAERLDAQRRRAEDDERHARAVLAIEGLGDEQLMRLRDEHVQTLPPFLQKPSRVPNLAKLRSTDSGMDLRLARIAIADRVNGHVTAGASP